MKVKVIAKFKDKHTGAIHKKDTVLDISKERFDEILKVGKFVEEIPGAEQTDTGAEQSDTDAEQTDTGATEKKTSKKIKVTAEK